MCIKVKGGRQVEGVGWAGRRDGGCSVRDGKEE